MIKRLLILLILFFVMMGCVEISETGELVIGGVEANIENLEEILNYVKVNANEVGLDWGEFVNEDGVISYSIYRNGELIAETSLTEFLDVGLEAFQTYEYYIVANLEDGNSYELSNTLEVTTLAKEKIEEVIVNEKPSAPKKLKFEILEDGNVVLEWEKSLDDIEVESYKIYRNEEKIDMVYENKFIDNNIEKNVLYKYYICAYDNEGYQSDRSNQIEVIIKEEIEELKLESDLEEKKEEIEVSEPVEPVEPEKIELFQPGSLSLELLENIVKINWIDYSDDELGFIIEKALIGEDFVELVKLEKNITEFIDEEVEKGNAYIYRMKAFNNLGESSYSEFKIIELPVE